MTQNRSSYYSSLGIYGVNRLRESWLNLLSLHNWDWFAPLTFKDLPKLHTPQSKANYWPNILQRQERRKIAYHIRTWSFHAKECFIFILLVGNLDGVGKEKYRKLCFAENARIRTLLCNLRRGAAFYIYRTRVAKLERWPVSIYPDRKSPYFKNSGAENFDLG